MSTKDLNRRIDRLKAKLHKTDEPVEFVTYWAGEEVKPEHADWPEFVTEWTFALDDEEEGEGADDL